MPNELPSRNIKRYQFSSEVLIDVFSNRSWNPAFEIKLEGLPKDAKILGVQFNFAANCLELLAEHPSFAPVPYGQEAPYAFITVQVRSAIDERERLRAALILSDRALAEHHEWGYVRRHFVKGLGAKCEICELAPNGKNIFEFNEDALSATSTSPPSATTALPDQHGSAGEGRTNV